MINNRTYWLSFFLLLVFVQASIDAKEVQWLSADIGFFPDSPVEQIQAVQLSQMGATAVDRVVSAEALANPQPEGQTTQDDHPPVRATGLNNVLILPCAFADKPIPTLRDGYFDDMRDELRAYWQELSFNKLDIGQSDVAGWHTLPLTLGEYEQMHVTSALTLIFEHCTSAADLDVDYSEVSMINILLNDSLGASWAGQRYAELDGRAQLWPVSWNMDWAWERSGRYVLKHEMGHLFGMSHSMSENGSEYGNEWDSMSYSFSQHTIGYNKAKLGWLDSAEIVPIHSGTTQTITLSTLSTANDGVKLLIVPVVGSETDHYTVEFRQLGLYDRMLIGTSVVIHDIDHERIVENPISNASQVIPARAAQFSQGSIHNGDSLWETGETFISPEGVQIEIIAIDTNCDDPVCGTATVRVTNPGYSTFLPIVRR